MKKLLVLSFLIVTLCSFETLIRSFQPPQGHTGADGSYCTNCHSSNSLNNPGGSVQATGLPDGSYTAGTAYNFSIAINHSATDRKRWGFSIEARNSANQPVGTFSTTNANAALNGFELSHQSAQTFVNNSASFTYNNLRWTAPANPGPNDNNITFYYVGNAANGTGNTLGDFIYSNTKSVNLLANQTYTFNGSGNWSNPANWSNNTVPPSTITGSATITIDPIVEGECVLDVQQNISSSATLTVAEGKVFRVLGNLTIAN